MRCAGGCISEPACKGLLRNKSSHLVCPDSRLPRCGQPPQSAMALFSALRLKIYFARNEKLFLKRFLKRRPGRQIGKTAKNLAYISIQRISRIISVAKKSAKNETVSNTLATII